MNVRNIKTILKNLRKSNVDLVPLFYIQTINPFIFYRIRLKVVFGINRNINVKIKGMNVENVLKIGVSRIRVRFENF